MTQIAGLSDVTEEELAMVKAMRAEKGLGTDPKAEANAALDRLAKARAAKSGESEAKAMDAVLRTGIGEDLYAVAVGKARISDIAALTKSLRQIGV